MPSKNSKKVKIKEETISSNSSEAGEKVNLEQLMKKDSFRELPENVQQVVVKSLERAKHSDFYFKLRGLTDKINLYTEMFYDKVPAY